MPSITERTAEKKLSRMRWGSSPSSWFASPRRVDAEQAPDHGRAPLRGLGLLGGREGHQAVDGAQQLLPRLLGAVAVHDAASARITSPSAQYTMPEP